MSSKTLSEISFLGLSNWLRLSVHADQPISLLKNAYSVLLLKGGTVRVEVHRREAPTSTYAGQPLAAMSLDDLAREPTR